MTTIAMAAGMVPSAMAFGIGGEFRSPMAIAVISGLIVSTLLSLVFVPAIFLLMDDLSRLTGGLVRALRRRRGRTAGARGGPEAGTGGVERARRAPARHRFRETMPGVKDYE